jgi:hypothetical protein
VSGSYDIERFDPTQLRNLNNGSWYSMALDLPRTFEFNGEALARGSNPAERATMSFFIASGDGRGADLGGLEGADKRCQQLAASVGAGNKTWRAYLSSSSVAGAVPVNARDRIGRGPWQNAKGVEIAKDVDDLHSGRTKIYDAALTERGTRIPTKVPSWVLGSHTGRVVDQRTRGTGLSWIWDPTSDALSGVVKADVPPATIDDPGAYTYVWNGPDVLTGSSADGRAFPGNVNLTCSNWTSNAYGRAMLGHVDAAGSGKWNASHVSAGCGEPSVIASSGRALFYCFAQ